MATLKHRIAFYNTLATMEEAGVPPLRALQQRQPGAFQSGARDLLVLIKQGLTISQAMARDPALFSALETSLVQVGEAALPLTRLEFDLLHLLLANAGRVLTRERLLEQAWGYEFVGDTRAVDSAIKRLRAKLRQASPEADRIEAVRGVGYRFTP